MQREMEIGSLEEMCDLMCGGIEIDYDEEVTMYTDYLDEDKVEN